MGDHLPQHTKTSLPEPFLPSPNAQQRDIEIAALLTKLALHYWRPSFTPAQVKLVLRDFLHDLAPFRCDTVAKACEAYPTAPDSKFFPHPGALIAMIPRELGDNDHRNYPAPFRSRRIE